MNALQALKMAVESVLANKMRSFLTMLGVVIGVFSVTMLISLGDSTRTVITREIQGMGSNQIAFSVYYEKPPTAQEIERLKEKPGVARIAPMVSGNITAKYGNQHMDTTLYGGSQDFAVINNIAMSQGRFILQSDIDNRFQVAVVGVEVADKLYGTRDVVGMDLYLGGKLYKIVGVLKEKGMNLSGSQDNRVFVPMSSAMRQLDVKYPRTYYVMAENQTSIKTAYQHVKFFLQSKYKDDNAYMVMNQADLLGVVDRVTGTLTLMLGGIAGISLLVGGIGIMNIMLVSVSERTREIGIRKAIGAKRSDILGQFLLEAVLITGLGGVVGILLGYVSAGVFEQFFTLKLVISPVVIMESLLFSIAIGTVFGLYPANKASKLHPIEALRYE